LPASPISKFKLILESDTFLEEVAFNILEKIKEKHEIP
jgi:hypothetical protein